MNTSNIIALLRKEFLLEFRQKTSLASILLYVLSIVFISFLSFKNGIKPDVWGALFWIVLFFAAINAASKSFFTESKTRGIYNYTLYHPTEFVVSKIIYNILLLWVVSICSVFCFSWLINYPVQDSLLFIITLLIGSTALAGALTLMSCIASKTGNNYSVMSLLSMPVCIPVMLMSLRLTKNAIDGLEWSVSYNFLGGLFLIDVIIITLSLFLFRYLWKE
ncbi:MAG TPA: heme exporter protein CcmB [Bacteroidia bacterium]|nr:heme exporter protein CcmB [Bacteroidia bacterium]